MNRNQISSRQFTILVTLYVIGTTVLFIPSTMAKAAKQDGWIPPILAVLIGMIVIFIYVKIGSLFKDKTLVECMEALLGKWLGNFLAMNFVLFCFFSASLLIWYVGYFVNTQFMLETPTWYTHIIFVTIIIYGIRIGLEPIARAAEILFPTIAIILTFFVLALLPDAKFGNLQPVLTADLQSISKGVYYGLSILAFPCVVYLMVFPAYTNDYNKAKKSYFIGLGIGGTITFLIVIITIMTMGSALTSQMLFSSFWISKKIHVFIGLERIEVIIAMIWLITIYYKILFYIYAGILGFSKIFKIKDYRYITLPIGVILVILSLISYPDIAYASSWEALNWPTLVSVYGLIVPLLLLIIALVKNKINQTHRIKIKKDTQDPS